MPATCVQPQASSACAGLYHGCMHAAGTPLTRVKGASIECLLQPLHVCLHKLHPHPVPQAQLSCTAPCLPQHAAAEVDGGERGQGRGIVKGQVEPCAHRRLQHVAVSQRQQLLPQRRESQLFRRAAAIKVIICSCIAVICSFYARYLLPPAPAAICTRRRSCPPPQWSRDQQRPRCAMQLPPRHNLLRFGSCWLCVARLEEFRCGNACRHA